MANQFTAAEALAAEAPPSTNFDVAPHFNPDESADGNRAVREMLAEHKTLLDRHANLAWNDRLEVRAPNGYVVPTDKRVRKSGFDRRLPYKGPYGGKSGYYVQNRKIFKGGQAVVTLDQVPETVTITETEDGSTKGEKLKVIFALREHVRLALALTDQEILAADNLRCRVCIDFRGENQIGLMAHFRRHHPRELDALVDGIEGMRAEQPVEEPPPAAPVKARQTFRAGA